VVFDAGLVQHIAAVTTQLGLSQRRMTSGAGHDAQMLARIAPAAVAQASNSANSKPQRINSVCRERIDFT
jgi:acetylornithine deacetylase/succinyl-diaminopimelate desuccinylase-like protein